MRLNRSKLVSVLAVSGLAFWPALTSVAAAAPVHCHVSGGSQGRIGGRAEPPLGAARATTLAGGTKGLSVGDSWVVYMDGGMRAASLGNQMFQPGYQG